MGANTSSSSLPADPFSLLRAGLTIMLLAVSTFYTFLNVNIWVTFHKVERVIWLSISAVYLLRWAMCATILYYVCSSVAIKEEAWISNGRAYNSRFINYVFV